MRRSHSRLTGGSSGSASTRSSLHSCWYARVSAVKVVLACSTGQWWALPIGALLELQLIFLAYHHEAVTWWHRGSPPPMVSSGYLDRAARAAAIAAAISCADPLRSCCCFATNCWDPEGSCAAAKTRK